MKKSGFLAKNLLEIAYKAQHVENYIFCKSLIFLDFLHVRSVYKSLCKVFYTLSCEGACRKWSWCKNPRLRHQTSRNGKRIFRFSFYYCLHKSRITSPAIMSPATEGTKAQEPGAAPFPFSSTCESFGACDSTGFSFE